MRPCAGAIYQLIGRAKEAEVAEKEAIAIESKLVEKYPKIAEYQDNLADTYNNLLALYCVTGRNHELESTLQSAVAVLNISDHRATFAGSYNSIAWLEATTTMRNAAMEKKQSRTPIGFSIDRRKNWNFFDTIAAAYAENGDFEKAKQWCAKAIELAATDKSVTDKNKAEMASRLELYNKKALPGRFEKVER